MSKDLTKIFYSSNLNAPKLENAYGGVIDVLDACLVTGFGSTPVGRIIVDGRTALIELLSNHGFKKHQVILLTGSQQDQLNSEFRITEIVSSSSFRIQLDETPDFLQATGVITCSLAGLGFEKPFQSKNSLGGGKAAYQSKSNSVASKPFLRVVDEIDSAYNPSFAKYAKVGIVEHMSNIDDLSGVQAPFDASNPNKNWVGSSSGANIYNGWAKWYYAGVNNPNNTNNANISNQYFKDEREPENGQRDWVLIGNDECFYFLNKIGTNSTGYTVYGFGVFDDYFGLGRSFLASHLFYQPIDWSDINGAARVGSNGLLTKEYANNLLISKPINLSTTYATATVFTPTNYPGRDSFVTPSTSLGMVQFTDVQLFSQNCFIGKLPFYKWACQIQHLSNLQTFEDNNKAYIAIKVNVRNPPYGAIGEVIFEIGDI